MKATIFFIFLSCLLLFSCTPKNEEVTEELIKEESPKELHDTLTNARVDGTSTDEDVSSPTFPLPPAILQLLADKYPGWQEPAYTASVLQMAQNNIQGPGIIRGDFNGDNLQDYVVQVQQQKQVVIVALLNSQNGNWQLLEIKKDSLFNDSDAFKSPYLLHVTERRTTLKHTDSKKQSKALYETVTLNLNGNDTAYQFENGKFIPYSYIK